MLHEEDADYQRFLAEQDADRFYAESENAHAAMFSEMERANEAQYQRDTLRSVLERLIEASETVYGEVFGGGFYDGDSVYAHDLSAAIDAAREALQSA